mmetsp:Transcript_33755/g.65198  ORF Transcript_33755/g.65198 Transcript_33755/m.65198 type:complete len:199 (-) Transcript_33755:1015-1611(-)
MGSACPMFGVVSQISSDGERRELGSNNINSSPWEKFDVLDESAEKASPVHVKFVEDVWAKDVQSPSHLPCENPAPPMDTADVNRVARVQGVMKAVFLRLSDIERARSNPAGFTEERRNRLEDLARILKRTVSEAKIAFDIGEKAKCLFCQKELKVVKNRGKTKSWGFDSANIVNHLLNTCSKPEKKTTLRRDHRDPTA